MFGSRDVNKYCVIFPRQSSLHSPLSPQFFNTWNFQQQKLTSVQNCTNDTTSVRVFSDPE